MATTQLQKYRRKRRTSQSLRAEPDVLKTDITLSDLQTGTDRDTNTIVGYVVAQEGFFKSKGRGQFTRQSLEMIVALGQENKRGVRSRFGHPNMSDDGLGKFLGRGVNYRLDTSGEVWKVRADLQLNPTSLKEPPAGGRPLGEYIMDLAETDPGAFSSSLVLYADKLYPDEDGPNADDPPTWLPTDILASDVVDTGDAVDDFLSTDLLNDLPTGEVHAATKLIDSKFDGQPRDVVEARLRAFCDKYLDHKFGQVEEVTEPTGEKLMTETPKDDRIEALETKVDGVVDSVGKLAEALQQDREERAAQLAEQRKRDAAEERSKRITALCAQCGVGAQQASEWIADESLSVEDVKDKLLLQKYSDNTPAGPELSSEEASTELNLRQEFQQFARDHALLGMTEDRFVELRKKEISGEVQLGVWEMDELALFNSQYAKTAPSN